MLWYNTQKSHRKGVKNRGEFITCYNSHITQMPSPLWRTFGTKHPWMHSHNSPVFHLLETSYGWPNFSFFIQHSKELLELELERKMEYKRHVPHFCILRIFCFRDNFKFRRKFWVLNIGLLIDGSLFYSN